MLMLGTHIRNARRKGAEHFAGVLTITHCIRVSDNQEIRTKPNDFPLLTNWNKPAMEPTAGSRKGPKGEVAVKPRLEEVAERRRGRKTKAQGSGRKEAWS